MKPDDLPSDFSSDPLLRLRREISDEASQCVACGLCVPHCPSYRVTLSEADSPRGRIALMNGVATGRIPLNPRFALHMDRCLTCRACEAVCPNHVHFGQLIDDAREMILSPRFEVGGNNPGLRVPRFRKWVERELIARPSRIDALRPLLRFYQRSGLQKWVRKSGLLGKTKLALLEAQIPFIDQPRSSSWSAVYPAAGKPRGEVALFLGCVARVADATTLDATLFVLNQLGYTVHVPSAQACCGALQRHRGDVDAAEQLERQNVQAFAGLDAGLDLGAIITTASGCGAQLSEYSSFPSFPAWQRTTGVPAAGPQAGGENTRRSPPKVLDISEFLAGAEGWEDIRLQPLPHKILVHEPCTLRNVLRAPAYAYKLLERIPQAQVAPLAGNDQCCGAAGTYFLDQPEISAALLKDKVTALKAGQARYLATSNVGCALHIAAGLREAGLEIEVIHPVTLIARQMGMQSRK
ncbi:MAG: (Fe-S)-binding protein [Nitrosospira multiformis]|nr:(Fe-S)-binding protein [Nitrosospira multiformis]